MTTPQTSERLSFWHRMDGRENNFDFLRFALATLVIWSHSYIVLYYDASNIRSWIAFEPLAILTRGTISGGQLAVDGFFAISGLLIAASWERSRGLGAYLLKRVLRIYPGWIVASLFGFLVVAPLSMAQPANFWHVVAPLQILKTIVTLGWPIVHGALPDVPFAGMINGSAWTIRCEFLCYLVLALVGLCGILRSRRAALALFALSYAFFLAKLSGFILTGHTSLAGLRTVEEYPRLVTFFLAGTTFYVWRTLIPYSRFLLWGALGLLALMLMLQWTVLPQANPEALLPLCGTYALFYFAYSSRIRLSNFGRPGDFSYGLYLYAFPIQQLLVQRVPRILPWQMFFVAFGLTFLCAVASWYCVERPFLRFRKKRVVSV